MMVVDTGADYTILPRLDFDTIPPLLGRQDFLEKLDTRLFRHNTYLSK